MGLIRTKIEVKHKVPLALFRVFLHRRRDIPSLTEYTINIQQQIEVLDAFSEWTSTKTGLTKH